MDSDKSYNCHCLKQLKQDKLIIELYASYFETIFIMSIFDTENLLVNFAFGILFLTTLLYWGKLASDFSFPIPINFGLKMANVTLFFFLIVRWWESKHFPLSNLYESLLFLSWSLTTGHFLIKENFAKQSELILGSITAPSALFINAFASFTLPTDLKAATPLVPALQSNWLMMHVSLMILSYSMLILGSLFSVALLILTNPTLSLNKKALMTNIEVAEMQPTIRFLDNLSYRTLGFGFPLLTTGILSGAVWANQAWGSYWSWDPKETWALITWLIFAIYFHFRLNKKWTGEKPAIIATCGFVFLWVCYLGVNLLGKGLHSYGWFT